MSGGNPWDIIQNVAFRDPWLGRDVLWMERSTGLVRMSEVTDGKPGDGNDEDHEPDQPDPNGV